MRICSRLGFGFGVAAALVMIFVIKGTAAFAGLSKMPASLVTGANVSLFVWVAPADRVR